VRQAQELNPRIPVLARMGYVPELEVLRTAGADAVFSGEGEVALAMTESILKTLAATPEQIDRERAHVHETLFAGPPRPAKLLPVK